MNYLDYLCGVYNICFKQSSGHPLGSASLSTSTSKTRFYTNSLSDTCMGSAKLIAPQSAIVAKQRQLQSKFENSESDVVPKSCAGDWVMRHTHNETNFHPWQFNARFAHFELVPWRQQKKKIDLRNAVGCEPVQLTEDNRQQLRTLQKFEVARSKRLLKQRLKYEKNRIKRQIKVRLVFSLELHQKRMRMFRARQMERQRQWPSIERRPLFVFDPNCFSVNSEHWGYFSQRNKGVEELLVDHGSKMRAITNGSELSSSLTLQQERSSMVIAAAAALREVPCEKCRSRCVLLPVNEGEERRERKLTSWPGQLLTQ